MLDSSLKYRVDYRSVYNKDFLKQADKENAARAAKNQFEDAERAKKAELRRRRILARVKAKVQRPISRPLVTSKPTSYSRIETRIAKATGVRISEIRGMRRNARIVYIRQAIAYWAARRSALSYPAIGRIMGGRDHTTILYAASKYPEKRAKEGKHRRAAR